MLLDVQARSSCASLLSPPSSFMAVKHGPCLLTPREGPKYPRKLLRISYLEHKTNDWVRNGPQEALLATAKRRKFTWFGHVTLDNSLSKTILKGTLDTVVGRRNAGWTTPKSGTSKSMPGLLTRASCRKDWKRISAESSVMTPRRPNRSRD